MLNYQLAKKNFLQINVVLDLIRIEQEKNLYILQKKAIDGAAVSGEIDGWLYVAKLNF